MLEISTILGYLAVIVAVVLGISFGEHGLDFTLLGNFFDIPSIFITLGGTTFALVASFPLSAFKRIPSHLGLIFKKSKKDPYEYIEILTELSKEARKKGLLALEDKVADIEDEFLKESVLLIVDAIEPDKLKLWFEQKLDFIRQRNQDEINLYNVGAAYGPAFGLIGTLIGLVNMLKAMNLDEGPEALGVSMSVALITTFYGAVIANCFFTPMANKLEIIHENEMVYKEMIVEGVISIKEGENPKYIQEKLLNFLEQKKEKKSKKGDAEPARISGDE